MAQQKVFDFKEITFEYQSNGVATLQFYTDIPNTGVPGALAARLSTGVTIPSSTGISPNNLRKTMTIPLDGIQGTMYQVSITPGSTTQFVLLAGKVHMRPIGVFLDGAAVPQAEIWQTQPIAPGV
jgi:hypothetical protein